jgi:hypothetical protein
VPANSAALRGVQLVPGETAHYAVQVEVLDRASMGGQAGVPVKWSTSRSIRPRPTPSEEGNKEMGEGYLFITNKRLFFKGKSRGGGRIFAEGELLPLSRRIRLTQCWEYTLEI